MYSVPFGKGNISVVCCHLLLDHKTDFKQGLYYFLFATQVKLHEKMWLVKHRIPFHFLTPGAVCGMAAS